MMLSWENFKSVLEQNNTIAFEYNDIGNMYHIFLVVNNHIFYECIIKKYLTPSEDQTDFEKNWLI